MVEVKLDWQKISFRAPQKNHRTNNDLIKSGLLKNK